MLAFIIGAACVVGLAKMLRRRAWHARFGYGGYGPGCGAGYRGPAHGDDGYGEGAYRDDAYPEQAFRGMGRGGRRFRGTRMALRAVFERLETTPGQERVILAAIEEFRENRKAVADEFRQSRGDLAHAVEGGLIEDTTLDDAFGRQDRTLARLRVGFTEALKKVVEVLDEPQRKQVAAWLEGGFFRRGWGGSGRIWA